jgi:hypothetical protein
VLVSFSVSPNLKTKSKETSMPSLSPKDRVSLCLFSFTDGRRCRTPRTGNHPHFCFYHAQKEARSQAAESLAKDLACFFPKPVILSEAKDPPTIPPHRPPARPVSLPRPTQPQTPSTQSRPHRQLHNPRSGRQTASPTPSTTITTTASSSTASPSRISNTPLDGTLGLNPQPQQNQHLQRLPQP